MKLYRRGLQGIAVSLFLATSVLPLRADAVKPRELLVVSPVCDAAVPGEDFFAVIRAAASQIQAASAPGKVKIFSESQLSAQYAKIILHSYGVKNRDVEIIKSFKRLPGGSSAGLDVAGKLLEKDRGSLIQKGFSISQLSETGPVTRSELSQPSSATGIIVLGTEPLDETTPSLDMVRRVETGIEVFKKDPGNLLIFSGGRTAGSISEARMMALIAYSRGIDPRNVMTEEEFRSTIENAARVSRLVPGLSLKRFILVTRPTHMARAISVFKNYPAFKNIEGVPSAISKPEISGNFETYFAFHDRKRTRVIYNKILTELDPVSV